METRKRAFSLDVIQIKSPCTENWDQMTSHGKSRFCEKCQLHVHDVDSMSLDEVQQLVASSKDRLCVRMKPRTAPVPERIPTPIWKRMTTAASLVFAGMIGLLLTGCDQKVVEYMVPKFMRPKPVPVSMGAVAYPSPTTQPVGGSTAPVYPGEVDLPKAQSALPSE